MLDELCKSFFDLVFPPVCVVCLSLNSTMRESSICSECISTIKKITGPICRTCGAPLAGFAGDSLSLCGECLRNQPPFTVARSLVQYEGAVITLVHRLKYRKNHSILPGIREIIGEEIDEFLSADYIAPVPLHPKRLRWRGFNQSAVLAKLIFDGKNAHLVPDLLRRKRHTVPQSRLDGIARRKLVRNLFAVREKYTVKGSVITLVDDVYTTGTTVRNCSLCLLAAGALEVKVLTLARSKPPRCGR